ncbi:MAG: peptidase M64 N-terminal domain-containing protein, partial [Thermovirgaceae bacterium]|nr:peptidase M64 N-terminal domain-containing protein [Thermovirgaceae bacterium]
LLIFPLLLSAQEYDSWFSPATMRIDYFRSGDAGSMSLSLDKYKKEGEWAGSRTTLIDPFKYGEYRFEVTDSASGTIVFAQGYSSLFMEWQTTAEAKEMKKSD